MNYAEVYRAGFVVRYHNNPELIWFMQNDAAHTWGVVSLILMLHPKPTVALLAAAQFHDVGEYHACDMSGPFKRKHPEHAAEHSRIETDYRREMTDSKFEAETVSDKEWIDFCDKLEALLFVLTVKPRVAKIRGWPEQRKRLVAWADKLGVKAQVKALLKGLHQKGKSWKRMKKKLAKRSTE